MKTIFPLLMSVFMAGIAEAQFPFFSRERVTAEKTSSLSEDSTSVTIDYRTRRDLLIVPALINDTLRVNLIVDPRCQTLILFGKKFEKHLKASKQFVIDNQQTQNHKVAIGPSVRKDVPIVVVRNIDPMNFFIGVNGVIGAEMITSCEIEFDHRNMRMRMKPLADRELSARAVDGEPVNHFIESAPPYQIQKFYAAPMIYRAVERGVEK